MFKPGQVIPFIAAAYHEAALRGVNMRAATELLEATRIAMMSEDDLLTAWNIIDAQVNRATDINGLQLLLIRLRDHWKKIILVDERERLKSLFETDSHTGWIAWLHSFMGALSEFRLDFCKQLCETPLPFPETDYLSISQIRLLTDHARYDRWAEAFDLYAQLGANETLMPNLRARLLSIAAEVAVYHFYQFDRAKMLLEQAQCLASSEWQIASAWAIYYFQQSGEDNQAKAEEWHQRLIVLYPDLSAGYIGIGKILEKQNDLSQAETKYQQASKCLISPVDGYLAMLRLYGQKALFESHKDNIPVLIERINAVALNDMDRMKHCLRRATSTSSTMGAKKRITGISVQLSLIPNT
jgi:tetratricopeptide (TPR) repeat protein